MNNDRYILNQPKLSLILVLMLLIGAHLVPQSQSTESNKPSTNCSGCSSERLHRVEVNFKTSIVKNEYIVRFDGYYPPETRENYLQAALNNSQV